MKLPSHQAKRGKPVYSYGFLAYVALQLAACSGENKDSGPAADARAPSDAATSGNSSSPAAAESSSPEISTSALDAALGPETSTDAHVPTPQGSGSHSASEPDTSVAEEAGVMPTSAPLSGCVAELPATADGSTPYCSEGHYDCSQGNAYRCTVDEDTAERCWEYAAEVACPLWAPTQCEASLQDLEIDQPCNEDAECELWGGLSSEGACNVSVGNAPLSVSTLHSEAERQALLYAYDAMVAGGCVADWGTDSTPHEAVCELGQCQAQQGSCLDFVDDDSGADAATASWDASTADSDLVDASTH